MRGASGGECKLLLSQRLPRRCARQVDARKNGAACAYMAAANMDVKFQANGMTGAAASSAAAANGPEGQGADVSSPSTPEFHEVLQQMESKSKAEESSTAPAVTDNPASPSGDVSKAGGAALGMNHLAEASGRSRVTTSGSQDEESGLAAGRPASAGRNKIQMKTGAKQGASGLLLPAVIPGPGPLIVASGVAAASSTGAANDSTRGTSDNTATLGASAGIMDGTPGAGPAGGTARMASKPNATEDAAGTPDVTTTATSVTGAKTPASQSTQAATTTEVSASLQDAVAARAAATTSTAPPPAANMTSAESKSAAIAPNEHSKTDPSGTQPVSASAANQAQTTLVTAAAASAAAVAPAARLVIPGQSDARQVDRAQAASKPAEISGPSSAATSAGAAQNARVPEMPGVRATSAAAIQGPAGVDSSTPREHSNSSGQNGHPDSSSANSDKTQTAAGAPAKQTVSGMGASTFGSQIGATHDASGHSATANPLAASVNGPNGGTTAGTPGTASRAAEAGPANGGTYSPAAIAGQRDAGVADAGTMAATGDASIAGAYSAQLLGKAGRSEMRIQFEADGLGPVELRAAATGNTIGATISTDRPETHWLLANGVGTLHQALTDRNVQVERIDILLNSPGNGGRPSGGSANPGSGGGAHSNDRSPARPWPGTASAGFVTVAPEEATTSSAASFYREGRLSVRV
jgi:hypothetical protein